LTKNKLLQPIKKYEKLKKHLKEKVFMALIKAWKEDISVLKISTLLEEVPTYDSLNNYVQK